MTFARLLSAYAGLNLLVLLSFLGLGFSAFIVRKWGIRLPSRSELRLHYSILSILFGLAVLSPLLPKSEIFAPAAKVWSAPSIRSFGREDRSSENGYLAVPAPGGNSGLRADHAASASAFFIAVLLLAGGFLLVRDLRSLFRIQRRAFLSRKIGRVRIYLSDTIRVPFSYWLPTSANLVVPSGLIEKPTDYRIAVAHELQHHRHGDTRWVYAMWALRTVCALNPAAHLWSRWLSEIQEFACDETLVDLNKVESQAYARCLIQVAETALSPKPVPVCATGLTLLVERHLLKRRIEKMLSETSRKVGRSIPITIGIGLATLLAAAAYASTNLVQDRRVTMDEANAMAAKARSETGFPIVVNDLVLKQLNRYLGTPEGRDSMKASLARMENFKSEVGAYLKKYGVPEELIAVPVIESGYQNLAQEQSTSPQKPAGLWQFIPATARNFGLRVDDQKDERLDVGMSTDAALRLLKADQLRFNDWPLALLAYNMGETALQKGIAATGSRDAWTLIRSGYEGDPDYLPRVIAAMLILKNPLSIE